jgi:peptidoglycan/xylan/chitin deacetylase (PgdA/CDA1 family)
LIGWFSPIVFLGRRQRRLGTRGVPVFAYHKIASPPPGTADPFLYVSPARFESQLRALKQAGWSSAPLADTLAASDNAARKAVLTFDDGMANVLEYALQPLARHQFRAIQFLVPGFLGRRNEWDIAKGDVPEKLMDEAQVRDWLAAGHEIGSHSMTHRNLRRLNPAEARQEIAGSKKALEDRFGVAVGHFCYPYGAWDEAARDLVGEAGYRTASTLLFGVNTLNTPRLQLRRIYPLSSLELLAKIRHRLARRIRQPWSSPQRQDNKCEQ